MFRSDFRKKEVCSKSNTKMLYRNKFLVKWMHVLSLWELQVIRYCLYVRDIAETSLNRLFKLLLILKNSHRNCFVEKDVLKIFTRKHLYWSHFLIKLQVVFQRRWFPLKFAKFLKTLIFNNTPSKHSTLIHCSYMLK